MTDITITSKTELSLENRIREIQRKLNKNEPLTEEDLKILLIQELCHEETKERIHEE